LLRRHTGKAWFSNISLSDGGGKPAFDFQNIDPPVNVSAEHWFIRDVAKNSNLVPASHSARVGIRSTILTSVSGIQELRVTDTTGFDRAVTLYYCEKVDAVGGRWWNSIRNAVFIGNSECATVVSASSGANGLLSLYPFAAITTAKLGRMLAVPPAFGPRLVRFFYNPRSKLFCAAFDVALTKANRSHPGEASAEILSQRINPLWGLRDASRLYYQAFPAAFVCRAPKQGIWIPFTDPSRVPHPEDFGIAVHEGDESVASDDRLGILSFRYTEPMTWWMAMDPSIPRTYEAAMDLLNKNVLSKDKRIQEQAEAVLNSGTHGADGRLNVSFRNEPWTNGAVWVLNPNPALPRTGGKAIQADVVFGLAAAKKRYSTTKLSGEYLDSLEDHSEVLDYRKESLAASSFPPSFDDNFRPVIPQSYSTFEIANAMSHQLHAMGKLLMANSTPRGFPYYMQLMDYAGIEVNWLDGGSWTPDSDDVFCYRRTLCYHKPYMLLQNTDFSKFGSHEVALYFKKCLFYGVYPSFFSANAATHPYWEDASLYERDRALFQATIPLIRTISTAGWEPVTLARTSDPDVLIERYGTSIWTVFNQSQSAKTFSITFEGSSAHAKDLATGLPFKLASSSLQLSLDPGDCRVISLSKK